MKKLFELLPFPRDDRSRFLFSAGAAALLLIVALFLPLLFRAETADTAPADAASAAERVLLFLDCVRMESGEEPERPLRIEKLSEPETETAAFCETLMRTLAARCIQDDAVTYEAPSGSEYTVVTDASEKTLSLCRMWLESKGDWQNWLDVRFDADTGVIYYLYLSRECITNAERYSMPGEEDVTAETVASAVAVDTGWTLRTLQPAGDGSTLAVFSANGETVCYRIACRAFGSLIDVRITCV